MWSADCEEAVLSGLDTLKREPPHGARSPDQTVGSRDQRQLGRRPVARQQDVRVAPAVSGDDQFEEDQGVHDEAIELTGSARSVLADCLAGVEVAWPAAALDLVG